MPPLARSMTVLLALAVGLSYGLPCLPGGEAAATIETGDHGTHGGHSLASMASPNRAAAAATHHEHDGHSAPPVDADTDVSAPCPCGCGQDAGPAGVSARPGPALRLSIASLPAALEPAHGLAASPRLAPAPFFGLDHVPI